MWERRPTDGISAGTRISMTYYILDLTTDGFFGWGKIPQTNDGGKKYAIPRVFVL